MKEKWIPTRLENAAVRRVLQVRPAVPPRWGGVVFSLWQVLRFLGLLLILRMRRVDAKRKATIIRAFIEQRGGLWIKITQTVASRHDALPEVYCNELGKLFDSAAAFPWNQARPVIEGGLGCPIEEVFSEFSEEPIAAASIAQTYKARLRSGAAVAVKVRRPYIEDIFRRDLKLVRMIANILQRIPSFQHVNLPDMHGELELMLLEELDFRIEAILIRDMRKNLKKRKVVVPKVFFRHCTREVLVMSFIDGILMSDYLRAIAEDPLRVSAWQAENRIDTRKVARRIYVSCQRQVFEDNLFHGDLHPGNIMLLRNSRFALLDFGAVGTLDLNTRKQVMLYHRFVAEGDLSKAMMVLIHMSSPVPQIDLTQFIRRLVRLTQKSLRFMTVKGVSFEERIYSDATHQQLRLMGQAKIPVSWDFLRAQRTFTVLEMSLRQLDPRMQPMKLSRSYFEERATRLERAAGGELRQLLVGIEELTRDAGSVLRDLSDAKAMAGRIFGLDLGGRMAAFIRSLAGIFAKGAAVAFLTLLAGWVLVFHGDFLPQDVRSLLSPVTDALSRLGALAWLAILLALVVVYRISSVVQRAFR